MGVRYLAVPTGEVVFACKCDDEGNPCLNFVAEVTDILSKEYKGRTGRAFLFSRVYNVHYG